jgi:hypothetical protein
VARKDRKRSRQWHFSGSSNRFDTRRRYQPTIDHHPISKTFARKIIRCRRCGNRVVSNVSHCPFCGKNLLPLYRRFWLWIAVVIVIGVGAVALIFFSPRVEQGEVKAEVPPPIAIGLPEGATTKSLAMGTTVDCNNLLVTVIESSQELIASDGTPITTVRVQFLNRGADDVMLYSTQWQLETADAERIDCYIGKTEDGESIKSELDSRSLATDMAWTATLYFAASDPTMVLFTPNALSYSEDSLVTWLLAKPQETSEDVSESAQSTEDTQEAKRDEEQVQL